MREFSIEEQYALIALNGQDSIHDNMAKNAAIAGIGIAKQLQRMLCDGLDQNISNFSDALAAEIKQAGHMRKRERHMLEKEITDILKAEGVLTEIPNLLGCDMNYYSAVVTMREYKCEEKTYQRIVETVRADILEPGEVSFETICILWLYRECGCIHDIFSIEEQNQIELRFIVIKENNPLYRKLLEAEFPNSARQAYSGFLRWKHNLFKNPYLEGVNLLYPFLDRKQSIFIDMVILGTSVQDRRHAAMEFLRKNGHSCDEVKAGTETLVKIDNNYYRIWPKTCGCKVPIQGVQLLPVYR